jgi:quercetin dioxygenase-like cupin family protein
MSMRRVVTGFDENGTEVFVSDAKLDEFPNTNCMLTSLWRTDDAAQLQIPPVAPVDDTPGFPAAGAAWAMSWTVPARSIGGQEGDQGAVTQAGELPSGGAHATASIDINVVLEGSIIFQLEDGSETLLQQGDSIVVNGVKHTWHNRADVPVRMLSLLFGAHATNS